MRTFLFATTAAFAMAGAAHAADDATDLSGIVLTHHLEEAQPAALAETGVRVDVITQDQIRNSGFVDITESLQAFAPGLTILSKTGPFDYVDISFQGARTQDVLFLVDGVRMNNRLYASTTPLDTIPSAMVDRIEVLNGGQSLFYGTQGSAGVVNIVTRDFTDTQKGAVTVTGDSTDGVGGVHTDGYYGNRWGNSQIVAFASADYSKGAPAYLNYQPSSTDQNRGYQVVTEGFKYAWTPSDATRISGTVLHTDGLLDDPQSYQDNHIVNDRHEDLFTLKIDKDLSDKVSVYLKGYYHDWRSVFQEVENKAPIGSGVSNFGGAPWGYWDEGANALARFRLNKGFEYYLGYDLQRYAGKDAELVIEPNTGMANAVFAQIRTTHDLIENGEFAAGLRYTDQTIDTAAVTANGSGSDVAATHLNNGSVIWNGSGQYDFNKYLFVRGTLGTNFRLPSAEELFANDDDDELGNAHLKPESSRGINLSIGGALSRFNWELTGFARDTNNLITCGAPVDANGNTIPNGPEVNADGQCQFINIAGVVETRGGEFTVNGKLAEGLTGQASFTYAQTQQRGSSVQVAEIPKEAAKVSLDWTPVGSRFGGVVSANWTGDDYVSIGANLLLPNGTLTTGAPYNYGNFTLVNFGAHYVFGADNSFKLNIALNNAFASHAYRPSSGRLDAPVTINGVTATRFVAYPNSDARTVRVSLTKSFF
jgi:outer membrane cobalamin receptor